ncbi:MAG: glycoside hydrolase family 1 protein [Candidatus Omnitrophota bacterium]
MIKFPGDFLWGAATSSYQVEGNNINSDWWEWEKRAGLKESSGQACRSYELYKEDFDLAKLLCHNAHRLSIEWSRIEPKEGEFSQKELDHYRDVIISLKERNIEPIVTLYHFTIPLWFARSGGWLNKKASEYFLRYVNVVVGALCDKVRFWVTINEPMVYVYHAYVLGFWPPQQKSFRNARIVTDRLMISHIKAYRSIHAACARKGLPSPFVSIAKNIQEFQACRSNLKNKLAVYLRDRLYNLEFISKLASHRSLDFIGVNYYSRSLIDAGGWRLKNLLLDTCQDGCSRLKKNSLGWDIYPPGLHNLLLELKRFNLPVFILENGICTDDDSLRWDFIREHLKNMHLAMEKGVKVLGYIYWSLIDNYEWDKGFGPRFGLIEVDYHTYKRSIRESARKFSEVLRTGALDENC